MMDKLFAGVVLGFTTLLAATAGTATTNETPANYRAKVDKALADYKKCQALAGTKKESCMSAVRAKFGK